MFRLSQPNNDLTEVMVNVYDDVSNTIIDIKKEKYNIEQHDIRIELRFYYAYKQIRRT